MNKDELQIIGLEQKGESVSKILNGEYETLKKCKTIKDIQLLCTIRHRELSRIVNYEIHTLVNILNKGNISYECHKKYFDIEKVCNKLNDIIEILFKFNGKINEDIIQLSREYKILNNIIENYQYSKSALLKYKNETTRVQKLMENNIECSKEYINSKTKTETTTKDGVIANAIVGNVILKSNFSVKNSKGESLMTFTDEGIIFKVKSFEVADENKWEEIKKILNDNEISIDIDYNTSIKEITYVICDYWNKFNKKDKNKLIDLIFK